MDVRELTAADRPSATALWSEVGLTRPWNDPGADFDLAVRHDNAAALGFYERLGYEDAETTVLARWLGEPA